MIGTDKRETTVVMTTVVEDEDQEKSCDVHKKRKTGSILSIDRVSPSGYHCVSGSLPKKKRERLAIQSEHL